MKGTCGMFLISRTKYFLSSRMISQSLPLSSLSDSELITSMISSNITFIKEVAPEFLCVLNNFSFVALTLVDCTAPWSLWQRQRLCHCYLDFGDDNLYFPTHIRKRYSTAMCFIDVHFVNSSIIFCVNALLRWLELYNCESNENLDFQKNWMGGTDARTQFCKYKIFLIRRVEFTHDTAPAITFSTMIFLITRRMKHNWYTHANTLWRWWNTYIAYANTQAHRRGWNTHWYCIICKYSITHF